MPGNVARTTPRTQDPVERGDGAVDVVDQVQCLGQNDAVEGPVGDLWSVDEVADDGGRWIAGVDVEHVSSVRAAAAVAARVLVVSDLEGPAGDVAPVRFEETLDVVAVDRQAALISELAADRLKPPQAAPVHRSGLWRAHGRVASGAGLRPHEDGEVVPQELPGVRGWCDHAIRPRMAVRTLGAGERCGERSGGRRLEPSAVAVEPLEVPAPSSVRTPRMVRAIPDRAVG